MEVREEQFAHCWLNEYRVCCQFKGHMGPDKDENITANAIFFIITIIFRQRPLLRGVVKGHDFYPHSAIFCSSLNGRN